MTALGVWLTALRLPTVLMAVGSTGVGIAAAGAWQPIDWPVAVLTIATACCLQLVSNLANDYGDVISGVDGQQREGGERAVQSGAMSLAALKNGLWVMIAVTSLVGMALLFTALLATKGDRHWLAFAVFAILGAVAIGAAITYTVGRKPYGYRGLGDVSVFIFFGWLAVAGACFLQALRLTPSVMLAATAVGALPVAVLNINNIRDIASDTAAGKVTVAARLGRARALWYHVALVAVAAIAAAVCLSWQGSAERVWWLLPPLVLMVFHARRLFGIDEVAAYTRSLQQMVLLAFIFDLCLAAALGPVNTNLIVSAGPLLCASKAEGV